MHYKYVCIRHILKLIYMKDAMFENMSKIMKKTSNKLILNKRKYTLLLERMRKCSFREQCSKRFSDVSSYL